MGIYVMQLCGCPGFLAVCIYNMPDNFDVFLRVPRSASRAGRELYGGAYNKVGIFD
jgi:hypothetical protein